MKYFIIVLMFPSLLFNTQKENALACMLNILKLVLIFTILTFQATPSYGEGGQCKILFKTINFQNENSKHPIEIQNSRLSKSIIQLLKENSAGLLSFNEFLKNHPKPLDSRAFILSQSIFSSPISYTVYNAILFSKKQIQHWRNLYDWLKVPIKIDSTNEFMEKLVEKESPIYYIVPDGILDDSIFHSDQYTRQEMEWLISHPEKIGHVYFVFGLSQIMTELEWEKWFEQYPIQYHDEENLASIYLAKYWHEKGLIKEEHLREGIKDGHLVHSTKYFNNGLIQYEPPNW